MQKLICRTTLLTLTFGLAATIAVRLNLSSPKTSDSSPTAPKPAQIQNDSEYQNKDFPMLKMSALRINNVELGAPYSKVIKNLGAPLQKKKAGSFPCSDGAMQTLEYSGLTVKLDPDEKGFKVVSMNVTSPKWSVSGIRIGAGKKDVLSKFKNIYYKSKADDLDVLSYGNSDGWINFSFKNNKLVRISWEYNYC